VSEEVVREQHGNVLLVRINRPDARNALNDAVCQGVGQAVLDAESDPGIRAMVLTGTGDKSFCAGVDL
jgi:enoyl-CoA hydratase/carnithine racemase